MKVVTASFNAENWLSLEEAECEAIRQNLMAEHGDISKTAKVLGVSKEELLILIGKHANVALRENRKRTK